MQRPSAAQRTGLAIARDEFQAAVARIMRDALAIVEYPPISQLEIVAALMPYYEDPKLGEREIPQLLACAFGARREMYERMRLSCETFNAACTRIFGGAR